MIDVSHVQLGEEEETLVLETLRSGQLSQGPMVARLEAAFGALVGVRHAIAVSSGTTALVAALQALGVGAGDEVVTSPFTFAATLNAILQSGAGVRFADISLDDFNIDPEAAAHQIGDRTAVLMPVHLYGQPSDMAAIVDLAATCGARVIEDAAQALGAEVSGRHVGAFDIGCFSLYATKNVTTGEGGMVTTDDDRIAEHVHLLRNQGMRAPYQYDIPGHNYRMTDVHAALGIPQLERLPTLTERRRENAAQLTEGLDGIPGLVTPTVCSGRTHVFHQYTMRVTKEARLSRDQLAVALLERSIRTGIYYPKLVFDYPCYRNNDRVHIGSTPNADRASREVLSLPVHPALTSDDIHTMVTAVRHLLG